VYRHAFALVSLRIILAFVAVVLLFAAAPAHADRVLDYQITRPGSFSGSFTLPQNPTPSGGNQFAFYFSSFQLKLTGLGRISL
jgi:hypothetical protein